MTGRMRRYEVLLILFLAIGAFLGGGGSALADHSTMDPSSSCYSCHTLKTSEVLSATKSIRTSKPKLGTLANGTSWTAGMPLSCDFCHQAGNDVPILFDNATRISYHPVDTIGQELNPAREISCNDCHNAGSPTHYVTPVNLTTNGSDGYPDHNNVSADNAYRT